MDKQSFNIRTKPLGSDRHCNRFWLFNASLGGEANGMIIIEKATTPRKWAILNSKEKLEKLINILNIKGIREKVDNLLS